MSKRIKNELPRRSPIKFTKEQIKWLNENAPKLYLKDINIEFNKVFGTDVTYWQICCANRRKYHWIKNRKLNRGLILWKQEHVDYLLTIYKGRLCKETANMINDKFGTTYTEQQVSSFLSNHHLKNGVKTTFKKGMPSHNKGLKWDDYLTKEQQEKSRKTCFKKGHKNFNEVPLGTIVKRKDHGRSKIYYNFIKVSDENNKNHFRLYSRYLYEQVHNVKLNADDLIIHLDGNSLNDDINNLMLVKQKENAILNNKYKITEDRERNKASILTIRLDQKLKEMSK